MDTVYILALELLLGIFLLDFFPKIYGVSIFIISIIMVGVILNRKLFFYWVIPAIFLISFLFRTEERTYQTGEKISNVRVIVYEGKGSIEKIGWKYPLNRAMVTLDKVEDGEYRIDGKIIKKDEKKDLVVYHIKSEKLERIEKGYLEFKFLERNKTLLKNSRNGERNLYMAVISGERENLYPRIRKLFVESGVSHLLAISGMHLGVLLFLMESLLKRSRLYKRERNILLLLGITLYFLSVRGSPSLERAYIMAVIYMLGNIFNENSDNLKSLALAFIIGVILKPPVYRELSFVLSFWAMLIIFTLIPLQKKILELIEERVKLKIDGEREDKRKLIKKLKRDIFSRGIEFLGNYISFTLLLQLGVAPIIYYNLGTFSLKAIFLSLIITPIGTVYIILCFISLIFPIMPITNLWYNLLIKSMEFFH